MPDVTIRLATPADAAAIAAIYRPYVTGTSITFDETPPTAEEFAARIDQVRGTLPFYVAEAAGVVVGYAVASTHNPRASYRWSVNLAIYVAPGRTRGGVGRALYGRVLADLRAMGYVRAYAGITLPNEPSVGLHEAVGFRRVATYSAVGFKLGAWHDVGWWEYALVDPPPVPPREPAGFVRAD